MPIVFATDNRPALFYIIEIRRVDELGSIQGKHERRLGTDDTVDAFGGRPSPAGAGQKIASTLVASCPTADIGKVMGEGIDQLAEK